MKIRRCYAAGAAVAAAVALRLFVPQLGEETRQRLRESFAADPAYAAAFARDETAPIPEPTAEPTAALRRVEGLTETRMPANEAEEEAPLELPPMPTPLQEPETVEAFLESQAAFADCAIPENVDYHYCALPFDYAVPVGGYPASGFGYRVHPILNELRFHYGTDVAAWTGEQIGAFADGTVLSAGYDESYGWHLRIDHGDGYESLYAHCSALLAAEGQRVSMGEPVALVGESGLATGPHLHFELRRDGQYLNPEYYLNP